MEESLRGRPKKFDKPVCVTVTFEYEAWRSIQAKAQQKEVSASELVRQYVAEGIAKDEE